VRHEIGDDKIGREVGFSGRTPSAPRVDTRDAPTFDGDSRDPLAKDETAYHVRKAEYAERLLAGIEGAIPGFRSSVVFQMAGTPVTYQFYTERHRGMVGGFPQSSLLKMRSPRTGIPNLRLVGDSIFPGQSTAGVTLGAMRVAKDVSRVLSLTSHHTHASSPVIEIAES